VLPKTVMLVSDLLFQNWNNMFSYLNSLDVKRHDKRYTAENEQRPTN